MDDSLHTLSDLTEVFTTLYSDLGRCREELQRDISSQYRRRLIIREFCTFVEVNTHHFKRVALHTVRKMIPSIRGAAHIKDKDQVLSQCVETLSPAELLILEEHSPLLDESGVVSSRRMFPPTAPNIRFAISTYLKVIKTNVVVDFAGDGWRAMKSTIELRNRLTHPRCLQDVTVSDLDIDALVKANDWFMQTGTEMITAANIVLERTEQLTARQK